MKEIEIVFLDIDVKSVEKKLRQIGAIKKFDLIFKKRVFDYSDWRLDKDYSWLRLRDEGEKITLTFKKRLGPKKGKDGGDLGMEEIETIVNDFDNTSDLLLKVGLSIKFDQEQRRIEYDLRGVKISIDYRPLLKPFVEIEGKSKKEIYAVASQLGFNKEDAKIMPAWEIYKMNGMNEGDYSILTFKNQVKRTKAKGVE